MSEGLSLSEGLSERLSERASLSERLSERSSLSLYNAKVFALHGIKRNTMGF